MFGDYSQGLPGYDVWKTRLPDWWDSPEEQYESEFFCDACEDHGWMLWDDTNVGREMVIPCAECCAEVTLDDLDEMAGVYGFEPQRTELEAVMLPLHHTPV